MDVLLNGAGPTLRKYALMNMPPSNLSLICKSASGITAVHAYLTSIMVLAASVTASALSVNSGQTSTLTVMPVGTGPFTYQWYEGPSGDTSNPIAGATSATFTPPPLTGTMSYWVQVTPTGGVAENSATITITLASSAASPPTDAPLPLWAPAALGADLIGIASRKLRKTA